MAAGYAAWGGDAPTPTEVEALTAYGLTCAPSWTTISASTSSSRVRRRAGERIRGLAGIDEDFKAHRDRFLDPGAPEEPTLAPGFAAVGARGT